MSTHLTHPRRCCQVGEKKLKCGHKSIQRVRRLSSHAPDQPSILRPTSGLISPSSALVVVFIRSVMF